MADIELVIKIPKEVYERILKAKSIPDILGIDMVNTINAVKQGTLLPKGHEKLITEPTEEEIAKTIGGKNEFADCIREAVKAVFANASTIIEAESEE